MEIIRNSERIKVSDEVLINNFDKHNLEFYTRYYFTDSFLENYAHRIRWDIMCLWGYLSEDQMEKFEYYVGWDYVCTAQKMSFDFILNNLHQFSDKDIERMLEHNVYIDKNKWKNQNMDTIIKLMR
jgi:hypothetical protein